MLDQGEKMSENVIKTDSNPSTQYKIYLTNC